MSEIDDIKRRAGIEDETEVLSEFFWLTHPDELKRKLAIPDDRKVNKPGPSSTGKEIAALMKRMEQHVSPESEEDYREALIAFARMGRMLRAT